MLSTTATPFVDACHGRTIRQVLSCLLVVALVGAFLPTAFVGTALAAGPYGVQFDGSNDYVTFGAAPGLGARHLHPGNLDQADRDGGHHVHRHRRCYRDSAGHQGSR